MDQLPSQTSPPTLPMTYDPANRQRSSPTLGKLALALAKAQGEMENAEKDVKGNYGKYATLAASWNAIRGPLSKNEIAIYQRPLTIGGKLLMCTMLIHSSGEFLDDGELEMIFDRSGGRITPMQAMGSSVTYARRYTLQAATGIAPEDDDDGNGAGRPENDASKTANKGATAAKKPSGDDPGAKQEAKADRQQFSRISQLMADRNISDEVFQKYLRVCKGGMTSKTMKRSDAEDLIMMLEHADCSEGYLMVCVEKAGGAKL